MSELREMRDALEACSDALVRVQNYRHLAQAAPFGMRHPFSGTEDVVELGCHTNQDHVLVQCLKAEAVARHLVRAFDDRAASDDDDGGKAAGDGE